MSGGQRTEDIRWWCTNYKHVAGPFSSGFSLGLGLGRHPRCPLPLPWLIIISSFSPKTKFVCRVSAYFDLWFDLHLTGRDCSSSIWVIMMNCCRDHVKFDQPGWPGDHWPPALSKHSDTNNDDGLLPFVRISTKTPTIVWNLWSASWVRNSDLTDVQVSTIVGT